MNNRILVSVLLMALILLYPPVSYSDGSTEAMQKDLLEVQAGGEDGEDQEAAEEEQYYEEAGDEDMDGVCSESEDEMDQEEDSEEMEIEEE